MCKSWCSARTERHNLCKTSAEAEVVEYLRQHSITIVHTPLITPKKSPFHVWIRVWSVSPAASSMQIAAQDVQQVGHYRCSYEDATVGATCSLRRRNSSVMDEEIMKEDNRKVSEEKPLRFHKIGDITLKTWLGFILVLRVQVEAYFRDLIVFSYVMGTRASWGYLCTSSW